MRTQLRNLNNKLLQSKLVSSLLYLVAALFLTGCGGGGSGGGGNTETPRKPDMITISGQVALEEETLVGAVVAISKLDITQTSEGKTQRGKIVNIDIGNFQPSVGADGSFMFQIAEGLLQNELLYSLSLSCPISATAACPLEMPLHVVLSGRRLKQGSFNVNVLTEIVYQRLGYYITAGFKVTELKQEMDALARMLLSDDFDNQHELTYEDIVAWTPKHAAIKRPDAIARTMAILIDSNRSPELQQLAQSLFSPVAFNLELSGGASLIATHAQYAYVTGSGGLNVIDISNPIQPKFIRKILIEVAVKEISITDSSILLTYSALAAGEKSGLLILSIKNPNNPEIVADVEFNGLPNGIAVANSIAYIAYSAAAEGQPAGLYGVRIEEPVLLFDLDLRGTASAAQATSPCGVAVSGNYAYVTDIYARIHVVNLERQTPTRSNIVAADGARPCDAITDNEWLYVSTGHDGMRIYSLANPENPTFSSRSMAFHQSRGLAQHDNRIYLADAEAGLQIISVTNREKPTSANIIDTPSSARDVAIVESFAYVTDGEGGLLVLDLSEQPNPPSVGTLLGGGRQIAVDENYVYLVAIWPGLRLIDIEDHANPKLVSQYSDYDHPSDLSVSNGTAYIAAGRFIEFVDVTKPQLERSGKIEVPEPGWSSGIYVSGSTAYVTNDSTGLSVFDISQPAMPLPLDLGLPTGEPGDYNKIAIADSIAYLAAGSAGLRIMSLSSYSSPQLDCFIDTPGIAINVTIEGNFAYIADGTEGLQIIDISKNCKSQIVGSIDTVGIAKKAVLANSIAYLADDYGGVQAVDVSKPSMPLSLGSARTRAGANDIATRGDYLYVSSHVGLEILRAIPSYPR